MKASKSLQLSRMTPLNKQLVMLVIQFLKEEGFEETAHVLEQETGLFFDLKYLERLVMAGKFDQVDRYLAGFMNVNDNRNSLTIFFEIRKQKYLEALDRKDLSKALDILRNDLKVFKEFNSEVYFELIKLATLDGIREKEHLKDYRRDTEAQRTFLFQKIKMIIEVNPLIQHKLTFPSTENSRLRTLINHSVNWQHSLWETPRSNTDITTPFLDHTCVPPNGAGTPLKEVPLTPIPSAHNGFQPGVAPSASTVPGWAVDHNFPVPPAAVASCSAAVVSATNKDALLKRPRIPSPTKGVTDHQFADSKHILKRLRAIQIDEVLNPGPTHPHNMYSENDLPKTVVRSLNQSSNVVSMAFHPQKETILLVGTDIGDIGIWEVVSRKKFVHKSFSVWDASKRKIAVQISLSKQSDISVKKCIWSPDETLVGVAFSKSIVHMYQISNETGELEQHLQIDAHIGSVNDIAFVDRNKHICLITCGDDKTIKVWDARSGDIQNTFEGHEAPVYSVCPHHIKNVQFVFSTSVDGKIRVWFYDTLRSELSYNAPGHGCTTMAHSADGSRLFSCGTNKGESYLVEWDDQEGIIKQFYSGLGMRSPEVVKFATAKNKLLAAGDEHQIKFWDMDNSNILYITTADGGLPATPSLCFNKKDSLLAVTTSDNGIKILANPDGIKFLQMLENGRVPQESVVTKAPTVNLFEAANAVVPLPGAPENPERVPPKALTNSVDSNGMKNFKERIPYKGANKTKNSKFAEVTDPVQCSSIRLSDPISTGKIARLHYAYFGSWLLTLDTNAEHKLWKWKHNYLNPSGKVTTKIAPKLCLPADGIDMRNDTSDKCRGEVDHCTALTKNGSYVMSCSGGKLSLYNLMKFQMMPEFMPPPSAATFVTFHPNDCNVIAVGMEDATIQIYNCRTEQIKGKLKGHQKRITGLVFSEELNVLVSSGADAQLCVWGINEWEKKKSKHVHSNAGRSPSSLADTRVQFHNDQVHLLVVQDSQIAIYDAYKLECLFHWAPQDPISAPISSATYSCDSQQVYASFCDGSVGVFDADVLKPRCRIAPSAFMPGIISGHTYPLVIAAHPLQPNQFAVGMTDGAVHVIEPAESEGKWGVTQSDKGTAIANDAISNKGSVLPPSYHRNGVKDY